MGPFTQSSAEFGTKMRVTSLLPMQIPGLKFKAIVDTSGNSKSGPIKCDKGFKVRFDLRTPENGYDNWGNLSIFLIDSQVPLINTGIH